MTESKRRRVPLWPLTCCLFSFVVLILTLDAQSIWWDEGISLHLAGLSWREIVADRAANIHPPLYFFVLKMWTALTGRTPFSGRYLSALAITLLPAAVYRFLSRRVTAKTGRVAALLVAFAPPFIVYGQETRAYAMLPIGVIALWSLIWPAGSQRTGAPPHSRKLPIGTAGILPASLHTRALRGSTQVRACKAAGKAPSICPAAAHLRSQIAQTLYNGTRTRRQTATQRGVLLGILQAGLIGLHYAGAIAAGIAALAYGLRWLRADRRDTAGDTMREWLTGVGVTLMCMMPWVAAVIDAGLEGLSSQAGLSNALALPAPAGYVVNLLGIFHTTGLPGALGSPELVRAGALVGALVLLGSFAVWLRAGPSASLTRLWLLWGMPFLAAPAIWTMSSQSHPRYLFAFVIGGWLVAATVVAHPRAPRVVRTLLLAALLVSNTLGLWAYFGNPAYARSDVRAAAAYIRGLAVPGDVALVPATDWSLAQYDLGDALFVMAPPDASPVVESSLGTGQNPSRTVFALDYGHDALDPRDAVRASLAWGGAPISRESFSGVFVERWDMYGAAGIAECDPLPPVCIPEENLCLVGAAFQRQPVSGGILPIVLCWTRGAPLDGALPSRLTAKLQLYGPAGNGMAVRDDVLLDSALRPTDMWPAQHVSSYHLLQMPVGALPLSHSIEVGIYDTLSPNRIVTFVSAAGAALASIPVGEVTPVVTPWHADGPYATASLPDQPNTTVSDAVRLQGARIDDSGAYPGEPIYVSMAWEITGEASKVQPPYLLLRRADQALAVVTSTVDFDAMPAGRPLLETLAVHVPPETEAGPAEIALVSGNKTIVLGDIDVLGDVHTYDPPAFDITIDKRAGDIATLLGGGLQPGTVIVPGQPLTLTLIWRAESAAADQDLKIFTHLVTAAGDILAQHDGLPADWTRPTTGWLVGEIIIDTHVLVWSPSAANAAAGTAASGDRATLLVGLYDGRTGARIMWQDGQDALAFPLALTVVPPASKQE